MTEHRTFGARRLRALAAGVAVSATALPTTAPSASAAMACNYDGFSFNRDELHVKISYVDCYFGGRQVFPPRSSSANTRTQDASERGRAAAHDPDRAAS